MLKRWRQTVTWTDIVVWAIGVAIGIAVIYGTIQTWRAGQYTTEQWIQFNHLWIKAWWYLCPDCPGVYIGIWYPAYDQLRP